MMLAGMLSVICSAIFSYTAQAYSLEMVSLTVGWVLLNQLAVMKMPLKHGIWQLY